MKKNSVATLSKPDQFSMYMCIYIYIYIYIQLKSHPNMKYQYCTIFHSILQCNISLHNDIYSDSGFGMMVRVFASDPGGLGSISGRVIPKTQKTVLDASLLNTQHYKGWIKGKVGQSWERSSALPSTFV